MDKHIEQDSDFQITTSDFSDTIGKTHFVPNLIFMRCISGDAIITIDSIEHIFTEYHSFILTEYKTFQVKEASTDFSVTYISIRLPFYYEIVAGFEGTIFNVLLYSAPDLYKSSDLKAADLLFESLCILYENKEHNNRRSMAKNLIACYIYEIYELTLPYIKGTSIDKKNHLFSDTVISFYHLVSINGYKNRDIKFYAEKLNISSRYLYKIVNSTCHITPKQLIDDMVISLIKQMLLTTSLNNQQISNKFGFSDQSAFGQYFKRCVGISPFVFRDKYK